MSATAGDPDVLIVGGGPSGAAAAIVLARRGQQVTMIDRSDRPRPGGCSGLLTPRALAELELLEVDPPTGRAITALTLVADDHEITRPWPDLAGLGTAGLAVDRGDLGATLLEAARTAGVTVLTRHTAIEPIVERGFVRGATLLDPTGATTEVRSRYLIAADGPTSRFGRSIGTVRRKDWPFLAAIGNTWPTGPTGTTGPAAAGSAARHGRGPDRIEVHLGLVGRDDSFVSGIGWALPTADHHVRIGAAMWSTASEFGVLNGNEVLSSLAGRLADRWGIDPSGALGPADGSRIPVGGSVVPIAGPAHLIVGDAAGAANPLTGAGIEAALWSGRLAGGVLAEALTTRDPTTLQRYPSLMAATYGGYHKVGRLTTRLARHPGVSRTMARAATRSPQVADALLRVGLRHLRASGGPETAYRIARAASRIAPAA